MSSGSASSGGGMADELVLVLVGIGAVGALASVLVGAWGEGARWLAAQGVLATGDALIYTVPGVSGVGLDGARVVSGIGLLVVAGALLMTVLRSKREI